MPCPTGLETAGDRALVEGRPDEARALFFQAMRGQQRPFLAWIGVARASIAMGDAGTTQLALTQAMQNDPGCAASADLIGRTMLMLAQGLGEGGRPDAIMADSMFQRAQRQDPTFPKIAYHRGLAQLIANQPALAVPLLELAMRQDPADGNAGQALLLAYGRTGQDDRARALVESLRQRGVLSEGVEFTPASRRESAPSRPSGD
jgi:predicted Zn-dependent protease